MNDFRWFYFRSKSVVAFVLFLSILPVACTPIIDQKSTLLSPSEDQTGAVFSSTTSTDVYVIQAGDELEINFYGNSDLDQKMDVRPDGYMSLPLIGDIRADGLTVPEFISALEDRYGKELKNPRINVVVRRFVSNVVFIGGDVKEPSGIHFDGKITVLQAISLAGGYYPKTAIISKVLVIRRQPGKPPQRFIVDLSKVIDGSDIGQDLYLYQYDTVYVPAKE